MHVMYWCACVILVGTCRHILTAHHCLSSECIQGQGQGLGQGQGQGEREGQGTGNREQGQGEEQGEGQEQGQGQRHALPPRNNQKTHSPL